jgi:hypothetical protein
VKGLSVFLALLFFSFLCLAAQEGDIIDWDIDSVFDEPWPEFSPEENADDDAMASVMGSVKRKGIVFDASYRFQGGFAPGWNITPWDDDEERVFTWGPYVKMAASLSMDAQISEIFRVKSVMDFCIPSKKNSVFEFSLGDFFFDYNMYNAVFFRAGKYSQSWGISPNYEFTNLLARVPEDGPKGPSYIMKADVPIGVGGVQALALTRVDFLKGETPARNDIGLGGKYNLAFRWADFDLGIFYLDRMPLRSFFSTKTTLWNFELYNEWLVAVDLNNDNETSFAVNLGFGKDFFNEKLDINWEFFFNGEGKSSLYHSETDIREEGISPFVEGFNMALNLIYRFGGKGKPRLFTQVLYAPMQDSAQLIPGFKLNPWEHIDIYFAVPMALGNKEGYYYKHNEDPKNRPFSMMLLVTLKGSIKAGYY